MKHKEDQKSDINDRKVEDVDRGEAIQNQEELPDAGIESTDPLSKLEADLTAANDKYLRLYSDFENYKRRMNQDRVDQIRMANADVFRSLIPVIDDFERALKSIEETKEIASDKEGVNLIYSKIKSITAAKGLVEMQSVGKPFDAELHDALANIPVNEPKKKGLIIEEIEKGYYLGDKVIRHAKVIVGN